MLRTFGLFLLLAALVIEQVPLRDFGQAMAYAMDMGNDADDANGEMPEDIGKEDGKDPLDHAHWACPHPALLIAGEEEAEVHHLTLELDPIHFEVPTPPPMS